ncbi:hypothetical protein [Wolbachia endosymbiont (group A) of Bibio marci]|uniref:hypothetical protein n=1 Tax=Wolbachia endosymbiont (group A) of Bibio marci TaxID=2953987 RepID=UPI0022327C9F|nr:hypothetical protein [Wolbachia endosymbiont (group A) of Bibio marci]
MIFIVNYYQYKVRCNKAHWDPVFRIILSKSIVLASLLASRAGVCVFILLDI